jgi:hypothetical protein
MEEGGSYVRDYKGLLYCTAMLAVTAYTQLMFGPIVSLSQCYSVRHRPGDRPELSIIYIISAPCEVKSTTDRMEGGNYNTHDCESTSVSPSIRTMV